MTGTMRIKSYFAESVQDAMESARQELGPDAMLMNSKKTEQELRHLGAYEVVFGVSREVREPAPKPKADAKKEDDRDDNPFVHELADLRRQVETIGRSLQRTQPAGSFLRRSAEQQELTVLLETAGFSQEFAEEILAAVDVRWQAERDKNGRHLHNVKEAFFAGGLDRALVSELRERIRVAPQLGCPGTSSRVVMLIGPSGAGKTSTLVKLALQYGLKARLPVDIFSTDAFRVGAWEQLQRYARIAGATFEIARTAQALASAVNQRGAGRLILIDTPGYGPGDMQDAADWAHFAREGQVDAHLVLPATMRVAVGMRTIEQFRPFRASKLILTHWDEVDNPGGAVELAIRLRIPVSFIGHGQQIPEDLREASIAGLMQELAVERKRAAVGAA